MSSAELILYATATGPLADALDRVFHRLATSAPTSAQTYPPHCTLTGFFHRRPSDRDRVVAEAARAVADAGPSGPVTVDRLRLAPDWIGLELTSPWLLAVTAAFVAGHEVRPGDDPLRPKDWLHLSIAYGDGDLDAAARLAADLDPTLAADWQVGIWERSAAGGWTDLSRR